MRSDLIQELCLPEAFARTLPRTPGDYLKWLERWGRSAAEAPFESIRRFIGEAYEPTPKYTLRPAILPGRDFIQNVMTDGRGWSVCSEPGGLYNFVIARAVQFGESRGHPKAEMQALLLPKLEPNPGPGLRQANWGISYECATGFCTVVGRNKSGAERGISQPK